MLRFLFTNIQEQIRRWLALNQALRMVVALAKHDLME